MKSSRLLEEPTMEPSELEEMVFVIKYIDRYGYASTEEIQRARGK